MSMFVTEQDSLTSASHSVCLVLGLQTMQSRWNRRIFLGLEVFHAKFVICDRVESNDRSLPGTKIRRCGRKQSGLPSVFSKCRHLNECSCLY